MNLKNAYLACGLASALLCCTTDLPAQINIAAIAQFKYNQQHALAQSLSKSEAEGTHKHSKRRANKDVAAEKPPIIHAHNPTFKSIYGDSHRKNVR